MCCSCLVVAMFVMWTQLCMWCHRTGLAMAVKMWNSAFIMVGLHGHAGMWAVVVVFKKVFRLNWNSKRELECVCCVKELCIYVVLNGHAVEWSILYVGLTEPG